MASVSLPEEIANAYNMAMRPTPRPQSTGLGDVWATISELRQESASSKRRMHEVEQSQAALQSTIQLRQGDGELVSTISELTRELSRLKQRVAELEQNGTVIGANGFP